MKKIKSLRNELFFRLVIPLVFFVIIDMAVTYFFTFYYVNEAYDRWLLDSAKSLAQEIKVRNGETVVELPPAALAIFNWDELDKTYFKVISGQKGLLAGDESVPELEGRQTDWSRPVFFEDEMYGEPVRIVSMRMGPTTAPDKIFVYVAETRNKRRTMMRDIFLADLVPQILLIVVTATYLSTGIRKGLKPLYALADVIAQRSPRDLESIPETHVFLEAQTLTNTINGLFKRLALAIASQQRFIANAAHQLRTPLAGLKLQAERAQREQDLTAMKPALAKIQECADRLSHITAQLLVLARSEPIAGSPEWMPVNLSALVRDICIDWVPKALHRKIELSYEGPAQPIYVKGDKILLG
ncbi:MAG: sensor histidine kinase N-terminal domain-containing protein, partial [Methylosarcina sp.]